MSSTTTDGQVVVFPAPVPVSSVQGTLALDLAPRVEPPRPALRTAGAFDVATARRHDRRRLDSFTARFLQAAAEIAAGDRPVSQLLRHATPEVYADLVSRAGDAREVAGITPGQGRGPGRVRPVVVGVRTSLVRADALEACAHVRYGQRSRAVAARFEVVRDRWQCVVLQWG
ncbi:MAG: Rv3235 family protein [Nocardioides sp.]|nr:Rv3235 family protein [Nocardioides sp.]